MKHSYFFPDATLAQPLAVCYPAAVALDRADDAPAKAVRASASGRETHGERDWPFAQGPRRSCLNMHKSLGRIATNAVKRVSKSAIVQRSLDVTIACAALFALMPLLIATAIAIRLDSCGAVIFKQTRIGKNGKPFVFYKFRSMGFDAEMRRASVLASSDREGICFKSRSDPRITRVGRLLRRFSIDELPQIYNVLRGEMAIVGPRPALPCEVAAYPARAKGRLAVKPGITGLWQVSGRADIGFERMIDMDLEYAESRTLVLDIILILKTFRAVVSGRGAH